MIYSIGKCKSCGKEAPLKDGKCAKCNSIDVPEFLKGLFR
jgi:predicted ATP-dependent serine protease